MTREKFVVVVWRLGFTEQGEMEMIYEDGIIGPYYSEARAEKKAASIRKAIARAEWDEEGDAPDGVEVRPMIRGSVAARDAVIAHLVSDL